MTVRIVVRVDDAGMAANVGGSVLTTFKTFDIEHREIETLLSMSPGQYAHAQIVGASIVSPTPAHPAPVGDQEGFAWVLMRNIQPHTVFLVEADAIAERDRKRASEMEWRAQNAHVADVRTYWNVDKTPLAQANPPVRSGDQERIGVAEPKANAPSPVREGPQ